MLDYMFSLYVQAIHYYGKLCFSYIFLVRILKSQLIKKPINLIINFIQINITRRKSITYEKDKSIICPCLTYLDQHQLKTSNAKTNS